MDATSAEGRSAPWTSPSSAVRHQGRLPSYRSPNFRTEPTRSGARRRRAQRRERLQRGDLRSRVGKNRSETPAPPSGVNIKVEELDRRADHAGDRIREPATALDRSLLCRSLGAGRQTAAPYLHQATIPRRGAPQIKRRITAVAARDRRCCSSDRMAAGTRHPSACSPPRVTRPSS